MKGFILAFGIFLFGAGGFAAPVEIDGVLHDCRPIDDPDDDGNAVTCIEMAYRGPFNREESRQLCQGARSNAPARCAINAYGGPFSRTEAIALCTGARTQGPSDCALLAYNGPFSRAESMQLCAHPRATAKTAQCAIEAYRGSFGRQEAIDICKPSGGHHDMMMSSTFKTFDYQNSQSEKFLSKSEIEKLSIEANKKAILNGEYK